MSAEPWWRTDEGRSDIEAGLAQYKSWYESAEATDARKAARAEQAERAKDIARSLQANHHWSALDPSKGVALAVTLGLIFWTFVIIACLAAR